MKRVGKIHIIKLLLIAFAAVSCVNEADRQNEIKWGDEIKFSASQFEVVLTRAQENAPLSKSMYLGMIGEDSIFLVATEDNMYSKPQTKAEATVPESFNVTAFKDDAQDPYLNLVVTSSDQWKTYAPTMYWPVNYEHIHFFASTPNADNALFSPVYDLSGGKFNASFDYTVISGDSDNDADLQEDLIYAIAPNQSEDDAPVELAFHHLLSAVEFRIGSTADAIVSKATVEIENIVSRGKCSVTYPLEADNNIAWDCTPDKETYSQVVQEDRAFKLIPQKLDGTDASFNVTLVVGEVVHEFEGKKFSDIVQEWKPDRKYIYTITKGDEVKVEMVNQANDTRISGAKALNTGFTTSYIRAAIVGYWYIEENGKEIVASSWDIYDTKIGTLVKSDDWDNHWIEIDGIYYHKQPVAPGAYTHNLFESYNLQKTTGPVSGSKLKVSLATQAVDADVEKEKLSEIWPEFAATLNN